MYRETSNTGMPTFITVDIVVTQKNASQYDNTDSLHHSSRHSLISYFCPAPCPCMHTKLVTTKQAASFVIGSLLTWTLQSREASPCSSLAQTSPYCCNMGGGSANCIGFIRDPRKHNMYSELTDKHTDILTLLS